MKDRDLGTDSPAEEVREEERDGEQSNGVDDDDDDAGEDGDGFPYLQDTELTRLNWGRVEEAKLSFVESIRPSRGKNGDHLRWSFRGVGEEEDRSLSMASLSLPGSPSL